VVRDDESAGSLKFILVTNRPADESFTVQVCTGDIVVGPGLETATGEVHIIMHITTDTTGLISSFEGLNVTVE